MAQIMDDNYVKDVLMFFYPDNPPPHINQQLKEVAAKLLHSALEKSWALHFVPRPGRPSPIWLLSEAVKMFWRTRGKKEIYWIAKVVTAWQYRSEYELAKQGL